MSEIHKIRIQERPREKINTFGASSLTNYELLQVILGTGCKDQGVVELSMEIIRQFGSIYDLANKSPQQIKKIKGLKDAKAGLLLAAVELGRRIYAGDLRQKTLLNDPLMIYHYCLAQYQNIFKEKIICFYVDFVGNLIFEEEIPSSYEQEATFNGRDICLSAIKCSCYGVILTHNHPSGNASPSKADIAATNSLAAILEVANIRLVDHLIIGQGEYYSFLRCQKIKL
ncbi:MAG: DNA repair protein RadC [Acholeplasmatales bacterium]|jgi:DNA repair protein RadC|nr:DNA repair protein RadC [Acholeplasmatales bacterium]